MMNLNTLYGTKPMMLLNPMMSSFRHGMTAVDRIVDVETRMLGSGQGELGAARSNLSFLIRLLMPIFFSRLYVGSLEQYNGRFAGANFALCALMQIFNAEVVLPAAWRRISSTTLEKVPLT